jgi:hypothetical protein
MFADLAERIYRANFENKVITSRMRNNKKLHLDNEVKATKKDKKCCSSG